MTGVAESKCLTIEHLEYHLKTQESHSNFQQLDPTESVKPWTT
jgi:hypothetical protein